jgi:hypothetical protein
MRLDSLRNVLSYRHSRCWIECIDLPRNVAICDSIPFTETLETLDHRPIVSAANMGKSLDMCCRKHDKMELRLDRARDMITDVHLLEGERTLKAKLEAAPMESSGSNTSLVPIRSVLVIQKAVRSFLARQDALPPAFKPAFVE